MSKSPLIQYSNPFEELTYLLEDFTVIFTRCLDFIDYIQEFSKRKMYNIKSLNYKSCNPNVSDVSKGIFKIQVVTEQRNGTPLFFQFECDMFSGEMVVKKGKNCFHTFFSPPRKFSYVVDSPCYNDF